MKSKGLRWRCCNFSYQFNLTPWRPILGSVILCGTFREISQLWEHAHTLNLGNCLLYLSFTRSQFFDFIQCTVIDFIFHCVTVHTLYSQVSFKPQPDLPEFESISAWITRMTWMSIFCPSKHSEHCPRPQLQLSMSGWSKGPHLNLTWGAGEFVSPTWS